jgi:hypothetical protein
MSVTAGKDSFYNTDECGLFPAVDSKRENSGKSKGPTI